MASRKERSQTPKAGILLLAIAEGGQAAKGGDHIKGVRIVPVARISGGSFRKSRTRREDHLVSRRS